MLVNNLSKINKIYFVGIGGIGISAVAGIAHIRNFLVEGSDAAESEIVSDLRDHGITVQVPHSADNINSKISLVVRSVAVPDDNVEIIRAQELNIPIITYPQFLGLLTRDKYGVAVSGTDGKTTTTAMIAKLLIDGALDPTVVLGSKAEFLSDNWRVGESRYFVFESDEYRRAFANYHPSIAVITNINLDHLDYFKDEADYVSAFADYIAGMPADGVLVINAENNNCLAVAEKYAGKLITFAINVGADYTAKNIHISDQKQFFEVWYGGELLDEFELPLPGAHNIADALAAIAVARELKMGSDACRKSLAEFRGAWRRFQMLGQCGRAEVIADYAHTPDAVEKTIAAAREFYPDKKILVIFQPHQYNRTKNFFDQFAESFNRADEVIIPDIYYVAGRENPADFDVSGQKLAEAISAGGVKAAYGGNLAECEALIKKVAQDFDLVLVLGAGDIYEVAKKLINSN
jgi:UDP-N-acetylmuramate--alanine ligase